MLLMAKDMHASAVRPSIDFMIVTPLPEEMSALKALLPPPGKIFSDEYGAFCEWVSLQCENENFVRLLATIPNDTANLPVANLIHHCSQKWHVEAFILMGIAGGVQKISLGDVQVARYVYQWDAKRKEKENGVELSPVPHDAGTWGVSTANLLLCDDVRYTRWRQACATRRPTINTEAHTPPSQPELHIDNLATGDAVVDSEKIRNQIAGFDRKLQTVETESAGFISAIRTIASTAKILVVRGISDLAAGKSELDKTSHGEWRRYAASNAAEAVLALLEIKSKQYQSVDIKIPICASNSHLTQKVLFEVYSKDSEDYYLQRDVDVWLARVSKSHNVWLYGKSGVGKTTVTQRYMKNETDTFFYMNLGATGSCTLKEVLLYMIESLSDHFGLPKPSLNRSIGAPALADRLLQLINNSLEKIGNHTVICFDEFAVNEKFLPEFIKLLIAVLRQHTAKSVTLIFNTLFHPKEKFETFQPAQLERVYIRKILPWTTEELLKLVTLINNALKVIGIEIPRSEQNLLIAPSEGSPRFIKRTVSNYCLLKEANSMITWADAVALTRGEI